MIIKRKNKNSKEFNTAIHLGKRKKSIKNNTRLLEKNNRSYIVDGQKNSNLIKQLKVNKNNNLLRFTSLGVGIFLLTLIISVLGFSKYIQVVSLDLPSPDKPFAKKAETTYILSSNQNENGDYETLYSLFGEENREQIDIKDVPDHVKWAIIAAEDIDFYDHKGIDIAGISLATLNYTFGIGEERGGSTITQQLIKQTTLSNEKSVDRKLKEILLALKVEQKYSKDEILEMYINVNNYGSNVYGLKTASKFYFNKDVKDLTLSEAAILARIPQSPSNNSPTLSKDKEQGLINALKGKEYVLNQMNTNLEKINSKILDDDNLILAEEIQQAFSEEPTFVEPRISIKSPHFVFYVTDLLTKNNYNNGRPFTESELQTGGYRVYTSIDMNIQGIAEDYVLNNVNDVAMNRNGHNGAVIITNPQTGDIIAMVGSKKYDAPSEEGYFDGEVNVTTSLQSMGSTMKPFAYYKSFEMGQSSPSSFLPDIPVNFAGYKPKNWDGRFKGASSGATPRFQLRESRNIPAVILVDSMGIDTYLDTMVKFGYSSIEKNRQNFGLSLVLGGGEVTMVEHAQGYGVFANSGFLVKVDPIKRITRIDETSGNEIVVYEKTIEKEVVADQRAVYLVNNILNNKTGGPGGVIDGRDYAGKTGTSENQIDTTYVGYTPDFVIVGWNGNNDNSPMTYGSWGENVTKPWVVELSQAISEFFPNKTPFPRPGGISSFNRDLAIEGLNIDSAISKKYYVKPTEEPKTPE